MCYVECAVLRPFWDVLCPTQRKNPTYQYHCTLANFRIEKKIGKGHFSEVYKATYLQNGQQVALKKVQVRVRVGGGGRWAGQAAVCQIIGFQMVVLHQTYKTSKA